MNKTRMTLKRARALGYDVSRGAYYGTTDDRGDRWYLDRIDNAGPIDHRGAGYPSRSAALDALAERLEEVTR